MEQHAMPREDGRDILLLVYVIARHDYTKSGATKGSRGATRGWNKLRNPLVDFRVSSKNLAAVVGGVGRGEVVRAE